MRKKGTAKKAGDKSCIKVSDWVTFLSNERQGMMSNVVSFTVFLVAAIALILVTSGYIVFAIASGIIVFGCAGWVYFSVLEPLRQRGHLADEILRRIISGRLQDTGSIHEEWVLGLDVIRRGSLLRQGKARLAVLKRAWRYQGKPRLIAVKETSQRKWEAGLAVLRETWYQEKPKLVALKATAQRKWEAGLAVLRETWYQEKPKLIAVKETTQRKWEAGLAVLRETWHQEKPKLVAFKETWRPRWEARLASLREAWRHQWEGGISYSQASVASPTGSRTSYSHRNMAPRNKSKQVRTPSRNKKTRLEHRQTKGIRLQSSQVAGRS
jgi:hypothetical protein